MIDQVRFPGPLSSYHPEYQLNATPEGHLCESSTEIRGNLVLHSYDDRPCFLKRCDVPQNSPSGTAASDQSERMGVMYVVMEDTPPLFYLQD